MTDTSVGLTRTTITLWVRIRDSLRATIDGWGRIS